MNTILRTIAPSATNMIRADHTRVMTTFHQYEIGCSPQTKHALVASVCLALDIHAQVEEEFLYLVTQAVKRQSLTR